MEATKEMINGKVVYSCYLCDTVYNDSNLAEVCCTIEGLKEIDPISRLYVENQISILLD